MATNPYQDQRSDSAETYGGYTGYRPTNPSDDPYGATKPGSAPQQGGTDQAYRQQSQQQQQQEEYQPPESVSRRQEKKNSGFASFAADTSQDQSPQNDYRCAFYSYVGFFITGIFFFFFKRKRPFVRFHAAQSIVLFTPIAAAVVVLKVLSIVTLIPFIGGLLSPIFFFLNFLLVAPALVLWIMLMLLSWRGSTIRLPIVSHYADLLISRFPA
jgi:uncharacterized membrane protein